MFARSLLCICLLMCVGLLHCEPQRPREQSPSESSPEPPKPSETTQAEPAQEQPNEPRREQTSRTDAGREAPSTRDNPQETTKEPTTPDQHNEPTTETIPEDVPETSGPSNITARGLTYIRADGNRWVQGKGTISANKRLDISITGTPMWVVAVPWKGGSAWAVALNDGRIEAFHIVNGKSQALSLNLTRLPAKAPPSLIVDNGKLQLLFPTTAQASTTNHAIALSDGRRAFITSGGELVLWKAGREQARNNIKALPDARILADENDRLLVLTDPTNRYAHGVLGDAIEAASITLLSTTPTLKVLTKINIPAPRVVEGLMPIWADLNGDGKREIIVTLADASAGAQIVTYDEAGKRTATGPAIGTGNRWRNQVAVAPFGPGGVLELTDVYTPHIGGPTEFFRMIGNSLRRFAQVSGYTAHVYGSRNLDLGVAGDFNGNGQAELIVPTQARSQLGIIQRNAGGASVIATLPLNGQLESNIAAVNTTQGILIGGATVGQLHIWGH